MGKVTDLGRTQRAIDFKSHSSIWLAVGQTSAWPDEDNPPDEEVDISTIDEVVGYKLLTESWLVKEDADGVLEVGGTFYSKVADVNANTEKPVHLYLKFEIEPDELTIATYRQIGIFVDLVPSEGNASKSSLLAAEVSSVGRLVYTSNELPVTRQTETRHVFEVVLPM